MKQVLITIRYHPKVYFYLGLLAINLAGIIFIFGFLNPGDLDTDGGIFAAIAYKAIHGGKLYIDAWENKPPGIFYLLEIFLSIIPNKIYALYCFSIMGILLLVNGLYFTANLLLNSVVLCLLTLSSFLLIAVNSYFMSDGLYTEILGSAVVIWSLYAYHQFCEGKNVKYAYIAAFLAGFVIWLKEPFIFLVLPLAIAIAFRLRKRSLIFKILLIILLPSFLFTLLLWISGSLQGFIEMEINNFRFAGTKGELITKNHLQTLWGGVLHPLPVIFIGSAIYSLKFLFTRELRPVTIFNLSLITGCLCFVFVAHYSYSHYYLPLVVVLFYCFISFLHYEKLQQRSGLYRMLVTGLLIYSAWKIDQDYVRRFKTTFANYQPDNITKVLRHDARATLFIDYAPASEYYIKCEKVFPAFIPVPIGIHFSDDAQGKARLERMYRELNTKKPNYLITNNSLSEMAHLFTNRTFYVSNYIKEDSAVKFGEKIFLWKRK